MSPSTVAEASVAAKLESALNQAVRTPLHSLMGFMELLAMSGLDEDQHRLHRRLVHSAEELLAGSERVQWLLRLHGGHYTVRPARLHPAAFVGEVAAASDGSVSTVVAPDAPPFVDTDVAALHQLVHELISNASVHGVAPVVLAVGPGQEGAGTIRITVSDGGAGLTQQARRTLAQTVAGERPDAGVGLPLVRGLAGLLGGQIQVAPSSTGTHVVLTLPAAIAADTPAPLPAAPADAAPARALRVLLVEDNATNRLLAERQLTRLGHTLTSVTTGEAGVRAVLDGDSDSIDVVLMDRHLPDINGDDATRQIRAGLPADRDHLPILAVTADATIEAQTACLQAGMDEVLTKPVDIDQLRRALDRAAVAIARPAGTQVPTHAPHAVPRRGAMSLDTIAYRLGQDVGTAREVIDAYLGELPGRRLRIQASLRRGDSRAVVAAAESLRTSSDAVGATTVAGICAALGTCAAEGDLATARAFLPSLIGRCEELAPELAGL